MQTDLFGPSGEDLPRVTIYTDGACDHLDTRCGSWAAILETDGKERVIKGGVFDTTSQRMELRAILEGLKALKKPCQVNIYSDSQCALNVSSGKWKARANLDLVSEVKQVALCHRVTWNWVRGHNGHRGNEKAHLAAERKLRDVTTVF